MAPKQLAKDCDTEAGKSSKKMGKEEGKDQEGSRRIKQRVRNLQKIATANVQMIKKTWFHSQWIT